VKQVGSFAGDPWRGSGEDTNLGESLRGALTMVRRNLVRMIAAGLIFAIAGLVMSQRVDKLYKSRVQLMIERPAVSPIENEQALARLDLGFVDSQMLLLASDDMLRKVIDRTDLLEEPSFQPTAPSMVRRLITAVKGLIPATAAAPEAADPQQRQMTGAVKKLGEDIIIRREGETNVIRIDVSATSPKLAQRIAATLAQAYQDLRLDYREQEAVRLSAWIDRRAEELREKLAEAEQAATTYMIENNLIGGNGVGGVNQQQMVELNEELIRSRADLAQKRASFEQAQAVLSGGDPASLPEVQASEIVVNLRGEQLALERRMQDAQQLGRADTPRIEQINSQITLVERQLQGEIGRITEMLRNQTAALESRTRILEEALASAGGESETGSRSAVRLRELERIVASYRQQYERYLNNTGMAADLRTFATSGTHIVSGASLPLEPYYPPTKVFMVLGFLAGTGLVLVSALVRDALRREYRSVADAEDDLGLPVLSVLPQLQGRESGPDNVRSAPFSAYSEAVGLLRQSLHGAGSDKTSIVLVTSAEENVGKTTVAASLGESARASGRSVLLVDADLRFAGLSALYGMEETPGLCEILRGISCLPDEVDMNAVLDVIPAGDLKGRSPVDYLETSHLGSFLRQAAEFYDLVIVDAPPIGNLADCRLLAAHCTEIVVLMRAGKTSRDAMRSAIRQIPPRKVSGVVVTDVDLRDTSGAWSLSGGTISSYIPREPRRMRKADGLPTVERLLTTTLATRSREKA